MIVVDTSVLSLAFRRPVTRQPHPAATELRRLVLGDETVALPGVTLQEILSGVRSVESFNGLLAHLEGFPLLLATAADHALAAQIRNGARAAGIAVGTIDALIAAQTISARARLFAADKDFSRIAALSELKVYEFAR